MDCTNTTTPPPPFCKDTAPDPGRQEPRASLAEHTGGTETYKHHLIIDTLNFLTFFFPVYEPPFRGRPPWTLHAVMLKRVAVFLHACDLARWKPHFVMDSGYQSQEVRDKWIHRREQEIAGGFRAMPYNAGIAFPLTSALYKAGTVRGALHDDDVVHWY